ncbi:hypothetical protein LEP48_00635 [Isoptericola sp. NEAU-Y5]|uniref:Uncharacterized protein n=1 Tax=Isoptericola luteus TaxID=2879484 RepID=A0ABS7Z9X6_9MICO|nr:hypothetical protein [Isoptericola sp. NEAU-Y5]MCA5891856.1 hypothetical protein [Isoptericola sp. NEAU-Y5]
MPTTNPPPDDADLSPDDSVRPVSGAITHDLPPRERFAPPDLVDLRTAWARERDLATAPGYRHDRCDDQHGWLLDGGYDAVLEPVLGSNRMTGLGYYPLVAVDATVAAALLERLDEHHLATERQNAGPTLGTVLRAVVRHPDRVLAYGYVIGPSRCDERITVTTVLLRAERELWLERDHGAACECEELLDLAHELGVDDMQGPPEEITSWWGGRIVRDLADRGPDHQPGDRDDVREHWYRLWWD